MRQDLSIAFIQWVDAIYTHTGHCPREVFVDLATRNALVSESINRGVVKEPEPGVFEVAGVRVRVVE